jgi:RNA polymerase sigma factor (sigma-70 family)
MATDRLLTVVKHLRRIARPGAGKPSTDAELLARFAENRDEAAFAEIVQRHGPLVWAVCRGRLSAADADDAFQAAFIVLTRQARRIRKPKSLAGWLARVARRASLRLQRQDRRRTTAERRLPTRVAGDDVADRLEREEQARLVNEEMLRLPDNYYLPLLLCYFQGLTNEETARRLGLPHGTVCGRLSRARELLRRRLIRRGVMLTAGMLTVGVAAPPGELVAATLAATAKIGVGAAPVISIAEAVMNAMWTEKIRSWAIGLVAVAAIGGGVGGWGLAPATGQGKTEPVAVGRAADPPAAAPMPSAKIDEIEKAGQAVADGRIDDARKLLREAAKMHPDSPPAWMMLIRLYKSTHPKLANDKVFRSIVENAIDESRNHPEAMLELASLAVLEGRNYDAVYITTLSGQWVRTSQRLSAKEKDQYLARMDYIEADAYQARGDWMGVKVSLEHLMYMLPADGRLWQRLGRASITLGRPDGAYGYMANASTRAPELGPPELLMATAWAAQGDAAKAREWFEKAVESPTNPYQVNLEFAQWLASQKDWSAAKRHVDAAAKLRPQSVDVRRLKAEIAAAEKAAEASPPKKPE